MSSLSKSTTTSSCTEDEAASGGELRRGPWTVEEDSLLIHYISAHGEGRWNLLAKRSGLKRTGKSCRLRWLNYLKPDVKRGNLGPEEQLLILELHSKWGNRWSKIAQHLPGRTDNEIKNYWRTRVQKQARHLKIDSNSKEFQELIRRVWVPRLLQKVQGNNSTFWEDSSVQDDLAETQAAVNINSFLAGQQLHVPYDVSPDNHRQLGNSPSSLSSSDQSTNNVSPVPQLSDYLENPFYDMAQNNSYGQEIGNLGTEANVTIMGGGSLGTGGGGGGGGGDGYCGGNNNWMMSEDLGYGLWNLDEFWQLKQSHERCT